jgi:hypothetical protein
MHDPILEEIDENSDLDTTWIQEEERIQNIECLYCREPMSSISLYFIYINQHQYIDKVASEKYEFHNGSTILSKEELLRIIHHRKIYTPTSKYKFVDLLTFHVPLEPEHIQDYAKQEDFLEFSKDFFKVLPIVDEIRVDPSIFIFHTMNSIFFIFEEIPKSPHKHTLRSILRREESDVPHKTTKKVRIEVPVEKKVPAFSSRSTRKQLPKLTIHGQ